MKILDELLQLLAAQRGIMNEHDRQFLLYAVILVKSTTDEEETMPIPAQSKIKSFNRPKNLSAFPAQLTQIHDILQQQVDDVTEDDRKLLLQLIQLAAKPNGIPEVIHNSIIMRVPDSAAVDHSSYSHLRHDLANASFHGSPSNKEFILTLLASVSDPVNFRHQILDALEVYADITDFDREDGSLYDYIVNGNLPSMISLLSTANPTHS